MLRKEQDTERAIQRVTMVYCHPDGMWAGVRGARLRTAAPVTGGPTSSAAATYELPLALPSRIRGIGPRMALCPNWLPPASAGGRGTSHEHQAAMPTPAELVPFPSTLAAALDSATARVPREPWFVGQLVRVRTENRDTAWALAAIAGCRSNEAWCALLEGYVAASFGRWQRADSVFEGLSAQLPAETRCSWYSLKPLLAGADSLAYTRRPCADRAAHDRRLWWLATPFLSEPGNRRRAEHLTRFVRNSLVSGLPLDAHHDYAAVVGGDAVVAMHARYGWPDHLAWGGTINDVDHGGYPSSGGLGTFSAAEYSRLNVALVPAQRVADAPFTVTDDDFALGGPPQATTADGWWPPEFFRHPGGTLVRLGDAQRVLLRRDTSAVLLMATDVRGGQLDSIGNTSVHVALVFSSGPDTVRVLERRTVQGGERVVLHGDLAGAGIAGFELLVNANGVAGARSRFGIADPPTLRGLAVGACAVSDAMLLDAAAVTGAGIEDAYRGLLGSVTLVRPTTLGIAWESYGFRAGDSVAVALRIARVADSGPLPRLGAAIGVVDDPTSSFGIMWTEPHPAHATTAVAAGVPTLVREMTLDVSRLREGSYVLVIAMSRTGCSTVQSERPFRVTR
jgi:hypothetical protein